VSLFRLGHLFEPLLLQNITILSIHKTVQQAVGVQRKFSMTKVGLEPTTFSLLD